MHIIWNMTTRDPADLHHLQRYTGDKKVVLGLITTKTPELEDKEKVIRKNPRSSKICSAWPLILKPAVRICILRDR